LSVLSILEHPCLHLWKAGIEPGLLSSSETTIVPFYCGRGSKTAATRSRGFTSPYTFRIY
jgi:hypothetical protein